MEPGGELQAGGAPLDAARLKQETEELRAEVLRLHQKLEHFHVSDYNSLRRAYRSLSQHVEALEQESRGMLEDLLRFETVPVPPELVAKELGVAAAIAIGIGVLQSTLRSLPIKAAGSPALAKGLWLLGGAFVVARLTGGALAHMALLFNRNARRKRQLQEKLRAVEERIHVMVALQQWAERQEGPSAEEPEAEAALAAGDAEAAAAAAAAEEEGGWRRVSPAASAGSSAESAEMVPRAEELAAAEAGEAAGAAGAAAGEASAGGRAAAGASGGAEESGVGGGAPGAAGRQRSGGGGAPSSGSSLATLLAYAELGSQKRK